MTTTKTTVTAKEVQELRQRTGAGMMDSKRALEEANWNVSGAARAPLRDLLVGQWDRLLITVAAIALASKKHAA